MTALRHEFTCSLPAAPARAFAALTQPEQLLKWFAEHAEVEPRPGGAYRFWGKYTYGTPKKDQATQALVKFEPDRLLAYSWIFAGTASEVRLELSPGASGPE